MLYYFNFFFIIFFPEEMRVLGEVTQLHATSSGYYAHYVPMIQPSKDLPYSQDTCNRATHSQAPNKKIIQMATLKLCTCGTKSSQNIGDHCENFRCSCFASKRGCSRHCQCKGCNNPRQSQSILPPDVETVISSWGYTEYQDSDTEVDIVS